MQLKVDTKCMQTKANFSWQRAQLNFWSSTKSSQGVCAIAKDQSEDTAVEIVVKRDM